MVGGQSKMLRYALSRDRSLKILLYVQAKRFVGADCLARRMFLGRLQQPETGMEQGFRQQPGERSFAWSAASTMSEARMLCVGTS